ncbi:Fc.00g111630.m01.CDS01 [Cosmosporella sp. VM-42]
MSADLFAEFNDLSNTPPPPAQQSNPYQPPQPQLQPQHQAVTKDPSDFFQNKNASTVTHQPPSASGWSSFSPQPSYSPQASFSPQPAATSSWGNPSAFSKPPVVAQAPAEDDDGWGDFETADTTVPTPAPVSAPDLAPAFNTARSFSPSIAWQSPNPTPALAPGPVFCPAPSNSPSIAWQTPTPAPAPAPATIQWPAAAPTPPSQVPQRTRIVRASTMDLVSNNLVDIESFSQQPKEQPSQISWGQPSTQQQTTSKPKTEMAPRNLDMLFNADDFELQGSEEDGDDDDDFGDFETVAPPAPPPNPAPAKAPGLLPSMDLLSLDEIPQPVSRPASQKQPPSQLLGALSLGPTTTNYPQAPRSPSFQDRNPFPELAIKTPTANEFNQEENAKKSSPDTAWPSFDEPIRPKTNNDKRVSTSTNQPKRGKTKPVVKSKVDEDEWGAWDDASAEESKPAAIDSTRPPESWDWDAVDNVQPAEQSINKDIPPPINVPPPSVILSVFPDLLNSGDTLFKPMSGQTASIKQRILSDPKAVDFLQGYILLAVTAARVIAGRKQRWHRDKILAKSMSISAAGSKGMKLAGVDKTQSAREDREAADVVDVWRQQVGRLRSAVAAAKATGRLTVKVPELSENMHVQIAKMVPTAPKACIICGLKREERVAKVDYEVEDSFGEWWVEHWGHKACKSFWIEHEQNLRQR